MFSSESISIAVVSCVLPILSLLSVILRFRARKISRLAYAADDWAILAAMVRWLW